MSKNAWFQRVAPNPMSVRDHLGNKVLVYSGQKVLSEYGYLEKMPGFIFIEFEVPQKIDVEFEEVYSDTSSDLGENKVSEPSTSTIPKGFDEGTLKKLKRLKGLEWGQLKKEYIVELLESSGYDYSHIPDKKWDLLGFLKTIVKDL